MAPSQGRPDRSLMQRSGLCEGTVLMLTCAGGSSTAAGFTLKRSGRMLMDAATVRPPAELPHRQRRLGLVYPSCAQQQR